MKQAIIQIAESLPDNARLISTIHDELIVEVPEGDAERILKLVVKKMEEGMKKFFPEVPIQVEANICQNWGEKG